MFGTNTKSRRREELSITAWSFSRLHARHDKLFAAPTLSSGIISLSLSLYVYIYIYIYIYVPLSS